MTQAHLADLFGQAQGTPSEQLAFIVDTMRQMSRQTDPEKMVKEYGQRVRQMLQNDRFISLSRRDLERPKVRVTRSSVMKENINPWTDGHRLPVLEGGLLSDLIWGDEPVILNTFEADPSDPGFCFLQECRSLLAIPLFDQGMALNMVVMGRYIPDGFDPRALPGYVWMSNLFGRATQNLVLSQEVRKAYDALDRELNVVAGIQQSLLPTSLPKIPTLDLAVHYQTSKRAGGDYYDFFQLPKGRWGILMADVSGHGTPAAVIMAITHSIAHTHCGDPEPPSQLLEFVNDHLTARYTTNSGTFVTAFYAIYDPAARTITYASAGHCPPRIRRGGNGILESFDKSRQIPLGIEPGETYNDIVQQLLPGDSMLIYTDGITEARGPRGEFFGLEQLDDVLVAHQTACAADLLADALKALDSFSGGVPATDDRTLLALTVR
jgi:sigma-B regulation protein RsbU (phosphoserine phosphatase)